MLLSLISNDRYIGAFYLFLGIGIFVLIFTLYCIWLFIKSAVYHGTKQAINEELRELLVELDVCRYVPDDNENDFK